MLQWMVDDLGAVRLNSGIIMLCSTVCPRTSGVVAVADVPYAQSRIRTVKDSVHLQLRLGSDSLSSVGGKKADRCDDRSSKADAQVDCVATKVDQQVRNSLKLNT
jgi:hypothetical protein